MLLGALIRFELRFGLLGRNQFSIITSAIVSISFAQANVLQAHAKAPRAQHRAAFENLRLRRQPKSQALQVFLSLEGWVKALYPQTLEIDESNVKSLSQHFRLATGITLAWPRCGASLKSSSAIRKVNGCKCEEALNSSKAIGTSLGRLEGMLQLIRSCESSQEWLFSPSRLEGWCCKIN